MSGYGILGALFVAVLLTLLFSRSFSHRGKSYNHRGPFRGLLLFFLVVFMAAWASQLWLRPIGPTALGVAWAPFTFVAFLVAILLVAASSAAGKTGSKEITEKENLSPTEAAPLFAIGLFFWILLLVFLAAILVGYYNEPGTEILAA